MTDRELLELAAKAAGIEVIGGAGDEGVLLFNGSIWNPLTDDGDALRLAVKLGLIVFCDIGTHTSIADHPTLDDCPDEEHGTDPYAATRRAIVRAAAAIGKEQK